MKLYVVADVGCIECGIDTKIIGSYSTRYLALIARHKYLVRAYPTDMKGWDYDLPSDHEVEVFEVESPLVREFAGEEAIKMLAMTDKEAFLELLNDPLADDADLSFACEFGGILDDQQVSDRLVSHLAFNPAAVVREGAARGLGAHLGKPNVRTVLRTAADTDKSEAVRVAARDVLDY